MSNKTKRFFFFFIILFSSGILLSQETTNKQDLVQIISELQTRYQVQFNYAPSTIEKISLPPPPETWDFERVLNYLNKSTGLHFNQLSNNIVTIVKPVSLLCSYLKDKDTGGAIAFATVSLGNSSTVTDEGGYFELKDADEKGQIEIRHVGYKTLIREVKFFKQPRCGEVFMIPDQQRLAEVILYDYLTRGIDKLDDGAFSIDFNQFSILPGLIENDVLQSVQAFPGIQSINETVSNINIRGGSHDQNLILWDGIKMYQSGHFFGLISMYNPQITQRVTLRKNGSPVMLTDGVSGTISMETENDLNSTVRGNVGINFIDASGFADIPIGSKSSIQLAGRKSISNFWETPTYSEYFDRISQETEVEDNFDDVVNSDIEFDFYDTSLRWLYSPTEKDEIQVNFITANNELVFNENAEVANEQVTRQSNLEQNSIAGGVQYRRTWNDRLRSNVELYNTDYKLKAINANILNDQRFLQENTVSETGILIGTQYSVHDNFHWQNGYQFIETKVSNLDDVDNPVFRNLLAEVLRIHAIFSAVDLSSNNRGTHLNFGLRFNYLEKFGKTIWEPRLSLNHRLAEGLHFELLGEFKHQNTSQIINFQNDFLGIEKRRWQLSNNADIPVIESKQISTGLSYSRKGWLFNGVAYFKNVSGITTQSQGFQNQYEFVKTSGSYESVG
ncbi:MAG: TonB-dependent receptor, partial [Flavobacteriaceae bacterium]